MGASRDYAAGQVLTAAQADDWAQGNLGRTAGTTDVGPTSGTTSLDLVTAPAVTLAAATRMIKITGTWRSLSGTNAADIYAFRLQEGATVLMEQLQSIEGTGVGHMGGAIIAYVASPTAASHTYKMTITRVSGSGTATVQAAATYPIQIVVEDAGTA